MELRIWYARSADGMQFSFSDRGEFVSKGFDAAVRLYEVRWLER